MRILFVTLTILCLSGCSLVGFPGVYRINVEQGNIISQEMVDQLKPGMSQRQVRFILGTPLIEDSFNPDRWDYSYVIRNGLDVIESKRLTVFFEDDRMSHFVSTLTPTAEEDSGDTEQASS